MIKNEKKTNQPFILIVIIVLLLAVIAYLLFKDNNTENVDLSAKELYDLNLTYKKPNDVYLLNDFSYCRGDNPDKYSCENDYSEYDTYDVGAEDYQTAKIVFVSARILQYNLFVKFYIYNYEQQGIIYCNGNQYKVDQTKPMEENTVIDLVKESCLPYTYIFDIAENKTTGKDEYIFNSIN